MIRFFSSLLGWLVTLKNDKAVFRLWDKRFFELTVDFEEIDDETFQKGMRCFIKMRIGSFPFTAQSILFVP